MAINAPLYIKQLCYNICNFFHFHVGIVFPRNIGHFVFSCSSKWVFVLLLPASYTLNTLRKTRLFDLPPAALQCDSLNQFSLDRPLDQLAAAHFQSTNPFFRASLFPHVFLKMDISAMAHTPILAEPTITQVYALCGKSRYRLFLSR